MAIFDGEFTLNDGEIVIRFNGHEWAGNDPAWLDIVLDMYERVSYSPFPIDTVFKLVAKELGGTVTKVVGPDEEIEEGDIP